MTIIEQIKAEIERLKNQLVRGACAAQIEMETNCKEEAYDEILSFLSTLESEKPMNQEGLEEEIDRLWESFADEMEDPHNLFDIYARLACHFAQWGAEHLADARKTSPKDLEEASSKFATLTTSDGVSVEFLYEKLSFQEGAKWQKEQIMKNAKDGWIDEECVIVLNDGTRIDLQPDYDKKPAFEFEYAQDVRVIVLPKED